MIYSLRLQIFLGMVAVIVITVGMTAFLSHRAASAEVERVQVRDDAQRNHRLSKLLARRYEQRRNWFDAQPLVDNAGAIYGRRVLLTDEDGVVVADTRKVMVGRRLDAKDHDRSVVAIRGPEGRLGSLLVIPDAPGGTAAAETNVDPSGPSLITLLVLSGFLASAVAVVITFFLSRRVVAPVESLARVAHRVAQGDFSTRARAGSRGEVGELAQRFNNMVGELARTEEVRRNMVADLAHELRTPLTNIRGYVEGIADGVISPGAETLESMQDEVVLLARLIEDLQDLALAESGRLRLEISECDLGQLVRAAASAFQQQAQAKGIALTFGSTPTGNCPGGPGAAWPGDSHPAEQRHNPHAGRWSGRAHRGPNRASGAHHGAGQRPRHSGRRPAARVRAVLPGGQSPLQDHRRNWPGADHRPAAGGIPRRRNNGPERPGQRQQFHRRPSIGLGGTGGPGHAGVDSAT